MGEIFKPKGRNKYCVKVRYNNKSYTLYLNKLKSVSKHIAHNIDILITYKQASIPLSHDIKDFISGLDSYTKDKLGEWGILGFSDSEKPLLELIELYVEEQRRKNVTEKHAVEISRSVKKWLEWSQYVFPKDITVEGVKSYLASIISSGKSARTHNAYLQKIKQFVVWMKRKELLFIDLSGIAKLSEKLDRRVVRRALTNEESARLLKSLIGEVHRLQPLERRIVYLLSLDAGLRWGEIIKLEVGDVDLQNKKITIQAKNEKARRGAELPLSDLLFEALKIYLTDNIRLPKCKLIENIWLDKGSDMLRVDLKNAGIDFETSEGRMDFHALRHTFGTRIALSGVSPQVHMALMRHSTIDLTMRYYVHFALENLQDGLGKIAPIDCQESGISLGC